jgi:hypothetical protein
VAHVCRPASRSGDKMHLGPEQTAAFVRQVLAEGTYLVCDIH